MGDTKIEWTGKTWNPIRGCSVVSEGCRNCYAMNFAMRFAKKGEPYEGLAYRNESGAHWTGEVKFVEKHLLDPLRWQEPQRIFVNSMSDLFHESIPDVWIDRIMAVMALAPRHTFQVLTKRADRMRDYTRHPEREAKLMDSVAVLLQAEPKLTWPGRHIIGQHNEWVPLPNVWFGVSVENQETADLRIPALRDTEAAIRWVSFEPLLGPIDLLTLDGEFTDNPEANRREFHRLVDAFDWAVIGGESGPGARPMHPDWARSLRDQCVAACVPFFFKQWGQWLLSERGDCSHDSSDGAQGPAHLLKRVDVWRCNICNALHSNGSDFARVGKKAAGRLLDGRTWDEFPEAKIAAA